MAGVHGTSDLKVTGIIVIDHVMLPPYNSKPLADRYLNRNLRILTIYHFNFPLFLFLLLLFHRFVMGRVLFTYSNFARGLHGDVDVRWSGSLLFLELHYCECC
jgi:hypothetical protein